MYIYIYMYIISIILVRRSLGPRTITITAITVLWVREKWHAPSGLVSPQPPGRVGWSHSDTRQRGVQSEGGAVDGGSIM